MAQSGRSGGIGTGRRKLNPENCKRITRKMVIDKAEIIGVKLRRDGNGMWFHLVNGEWWNFGQTNYLAYTRLINMTK